MNNNQFNFSDVETATKAIRLAQSRGAFTLEESSQLLGIVQRLEAVTENFRQVQHQEQINKNNSEDKQ